MAMRYGIFSDIHGNLLALEAVTSAFEEEKIDKLLCVGDFVGYGANPHECIKKIQDMGAIGIAGNHDWAVVGKTDLQYFNPMAREAILWTKNHLLPEDIDFLNRLELVLTCEDFMMVHGTLFEPHYFHYLFEENQARTAFSMMTKDILFVGHTHMAGIFIQGQRGVHYVTSESVTMKNDCKYIVNVGSVGQPRDGNPSASYCVFDVTTKTIVLKRIPYDIEEAQKRILQAGLPPFLALRLALGQ